MQEEKFIQRGISPRCDSQEPAAHKAAYQKRNKMVRFVVHYGVEITISEMGLSQNYGVFLRAGTHLDLAGDIVRITIEEWVPTPVMTQRVVIIRGIRRHIEVPIWAYQRREIDLHFCVVQTLQMVQ